MLIFFVVRKVGFVMVEKIEIFLLVRGSDVVGGLIFLVLDQVSHQQVGGEDVLWKMDY